MTRALLDTSAYSAFKRGHPGILRRIGEADEIALNTIVLGELHSGFRRGSLRRRNEEELETFLASPRVSVIKLDEETADRYATIVEALRNAATPIPTNDIWIASTAMQHGLVVLTTDEHYKRVSQVIVEHFAP